MSALASMVSATGFGVAFAKPFRDGVREYAGNGVWLKPENGVLLGILAAALAAFSCWMVISLWNSRKWSLWVVLATHLPGVAYSIAESKIAPSLPGLIIAVYCLLRVTNAIGPK